MKFFFDGTEHEIIEGKNKSVWSYGTVYGCKDCGLVWSGRLVREILQKQIDEFQENDPISRLMLHRGEWKSLDVKNLIRLKAIVEEAIDLQREIAGEGKWREVQRGDSNRDIKRTSKD